MSTTATMLHRPFVRLREEGDQMTVAEEVEHLKLRFENLSGLVPEGHSCRISIQGWFKALVAQAHLLHIVFNLQAILEAKTGSDIGEEQDLTLRMLDQLREAAAAAEDLAFSDLSR